MSGLVYILEFEKPLGNERHRASYYIGYCELDRLLERLAEHAQGKGAAITRALKEREISFKVVALFPGNRSLERRLKNQKHTRRIVERFKRGTLDISC